ncbi:MAG: peptide chain release factor N(5)-glutamine methyltransferase [Patescibacteria group bacterium]
MSSTSDQDIRALVRDKYNGDTTADISADVGRLAAGEPLAYVIGWIPFLGLAIHLDSRPLIPRPETESWAETLVEKLQKRFGDRPFTLLDLCAGSGAIGLLVLARFPNTKVSFGELELPHIDLIKKNIEANGLDPSRAIIRRGNLLAPFVGERFDFIVTNPPYIPSGRTLDDTVLDYEPTIALFAGERGLDLIERIAREAPRHLNASGELWMECDIDNIEEARNLVLEGGAIRADIRTDQYGRPRTLVGYYA